MQVIIFMLSHLVPKNKDLWLFSAWSGFGFYDNPRSIFERIISDKIEKEVTWISKSKKQVAEITGQGYPCIYLYSLSGIWKQLRAHIVVYTHQVNGEFLSFLISENTKRVQTWHGLPIKKIDADDHRDKRELVKFLIKKFLLRHLHNKNDLVLACSESDQKIFSSAFRTSIKKIKVTGYPRNDDLLKPQSSRSGSIKIIYMPTFRGKENSDFQILHELFTILDDFDKLLEVNNCLLYIKLHPVQKISKNDLEAINKSKAIRFINSNNPIYKSLNDYNILITDYSGVYFDFMLLNKPIIMAPIQEMEYLESDRDIYYNYNDLCIMSKCRNWKEISSQIEDIIIKNTYDYKRHKLLLNKFHVYKDTDSSKRAYIEMLSL